MNGKAFSILNRSFFVGAFSNYAGKTLKYAYR